MILQRLSKVMTDPAEVAALTLAIRENPVFPEGRGRSFGMRFRQILGLTPGIPHYRIALNWAIEVIAQNIVRVSRFGPNGSQTKDILEMWHKKNTP